MFIFFEPVQYFRIETTCSPVENRSALAQIPPFHYPLFLILNTNITSLIGTTSLLAIGINNSYPAIQFYLLPPSCTRIYTILTILFTMPAASFFLCSPFPDFSVPPNPHSIPPSPNKPVITRFVTAHTPLKHPRPQRALKATTLWKTMDDIDTGKNT